jgi:hypothetical protein
LFNETTFWPFFLGIGRPFDLWKLLQEINLKENSIQKDVSHKNKYLFAYFTSIFPMMSSVYKEKSNLVSWQLGRIFKRQKGNIVHKYFRLVKRLNPEILIFYIYHVQAI